MVLSSTYGHETLSLATYPYYGLLLKKFLISSRSVKLPRRCSASPDFLSHTPDLMCRIQVESALHGIPRSMERLRPHPAIEKEGVTQQQQRLNPVDYNAIILTSGALCGRVINPCRR